MLELSLNPHVHKKTRLWAQMVRLAGEGWTAPQLAEAIAERFGVRLAPKVISRHLRAMGYVWKRTRYVPLGKPSAEEVRAFLEEEEEAKRGCRKR